MEIQLWLLQKLSSLFCFCFVFLSFFFLIYLAYLANLLWITYNITRRFELFFLHIEYKSHAWPKTEENTEHTQNILNIHISVLNALFTSFIIRLYNHRLPRRCLGTWWTVTVSESIDRAAYTLVYIQCKWGQEYSILYIVGKQSFMKPLHCCYIFLKAHILSLNNIPVLVLRPLIM